MNTTCGRISSRSAGSGHDARAGSLPSLCRSRSKHAPAWARLGRLHRFIGKFVGSESENLVRAEEAFRKAFSLNPELGLAHNYYTSLEADLGRSLSALERLLRRGQTHRHDPDLFNGLVQACRCCGLLDTSAAAHERARLLDPHVHTSVGFTFRYLNNRHAALANRVSPDGFAMDMAWFAAPGDDDAIRVLQEREAVNPLGQLRRGVLAAFRAYMEGDRKASLDAVEGTLALRFRDPEVLSSFGILLARQDAAQRALEVLSSASTEGYVAFCGLLDHPWLDSMRPHR